MSTGWESETSLIVMVIARWTAFICSRSASLVLPWGHITLARADYPASMRPFVCCIFPEGVM